MTLDGGAGEDFFQIGQVFGLERVAGPETMIAVGDEIETVETTLGFLSRGISFPTTILGGDDGDRFVVYSNKAMLKLFGEDGNDEFVVRAFVLVDNSGITIDDTIINGGDGDDSFEYNINAPVSIDGGAGADSVVIIGTELADQFVITEDGVQGAGLSVDFTAVERLEVDGLEGDDHFFVLSTSPDMVTTLIGGLGSDTFDVGGDVTGDIVALSVEGRSGFVNHAVSSDDPAYDGIFAEGLQLNVADKDTGAVIITESGNTAVVENDNDGTIDADETDTYTVKLSVPASGLAQSTMLYVTVSAALAGFKEDQLAGKTIEISVDDGSGFGAYSSAQVLTFDSTQSGAQAFAWDREITVKVRGVFDNAQEGEKVIIVSHSSYAENKLTLDKLDDLSELNINNVEVTLYDDDKPGLILSQVDRSDPLDPSSAVSDKKTQVYEGDVAGDFYEISLTRAPSAGETVTVKLDSDFAQIDVLGANIDPVDDARLSLVPAAGNVAAYYTVSFDETNWNAPFKLKLLADDDGAVENKLRVVIDHSIDSDLGGSEFENLQQSTELRVDVRDNDSAGIIVKQSNGSTLVSEVSGDDYTIELTRQPAAEVTVQILTDGQTLVNAAGIADSRYSVIDGVPSITFDASNWNVPFEVLLIINPDADTDQGAQPVQKFPAQPHLLNEIRGPLIIEGSPIPAKDRSLSDVLMLPNEIDGDRPLVVIEADEGTQNDVLNVFADGSISNDVGLLKQFSASETGIRDGLAFIYEQDSASLDLSQYANISGLEMGDDLAIDFGTHDVEEIKNFAGGITYRGLETVEIMLGQGNDRFEVAATLDNSTTVVHGGGNSAIRFADDLNFSGSTISRGDGIDWALEGFQVGQQLDIEAIGAAGALAANQGRFEIIAINGTQLTLAGNLLSGNGAFAVTAVDDAGNALVGGDRITVSGGGGETAPLIIYGDTSQDGSRYNFASVAMRDAATTTLTFTHSESAADSIQRASGSWWDDGFESGQLVDILESGGLNGGNYLIESISADGLTLVLQDGQRVIDETVLVSAAVSVPNGNARSFVQHGGDIIDARGASGGVTIYGGQGDDLIYGSEFGDHLAGGSGDDRIFGQAGRDLIYGDAGFNLDLSQRLSVSTANGDQMLTVVTEGSDTDIRPTSDSLIAGDDTIRGGQGDDIIVGDFGVIEQLGDTQRLVNTGQVISVISNQLNNSANDSLYGDQGNDLIIGGGGADIIRGNFGADTIFGDNAYVKYDLSGPVAAVLPTIYPTLLLQTIALQLGDADDIQGNQGDDVILGGYAGDVIQGDAGNDIIFGDNGDIFYAGGLVTRMVSSDRNNTTGGDDLINGYFGAGIDCGDENIDDNDLIIAGVGRDTVNANLGDDVVIADNGEIDFNVPGVDTDPLSIDLIQSTDLTLGDADIVNAGEGDDIVIGGFAADQLHGEVGNDLIFGDNGRVELVAGVVTYVVTTDTSAATGGNDLITGDDDSVVCDQTHGSNDILFGGMGDDNIDAARGDDIAFGDNGEVFLKDGLGGTNHSPIRTLDANLGGIDVIEGGSGNDRLLGGAQGDRISDTGGNNIVLGDHGEINGNRVRTTDTSGGADIIQTGSGRDIIFGGAAGDTITVSGGNNIVAGDHAQTSGRDLISTSIGSGGNDKITTGSGADLISGGTGGDNITAGAGADFVLGDDGNISGNQIISVAHSSGGDDTITAFGSGSNRIIAGAGNDMVTGGSSGDFILGDNGVIRGSYVQTDSPGIGGNDQLNGGGGPDIIFGGFGADTIRGGSGNDRILGDNGIYSGVTLRSSDPSIGGNDLIYGDAGDDWAFGGYGNDRLFGGSGFDVLFGDNAIIEPIGGGLYQASTRNAYIGGADWIDGGPGSDILIGGFGPDTLVGDLGQDIMIGDAGSVIFGLDGQIYLVDTFGADPLDRFVLFNLFGRDLAGQLGLDRGDRLGVMAMAGDYAMQDFSMGNVHRFQHHNEFIKAEAPDVDEGQTEQVDAPDQDERGAGSDESPAVAPTPNESTGRDDRSGVIPSQAKNLTSEDVGGSAQSLAGGAVILSLAGWRRKKARQAAQREEQRRASRYRVYIEQSELSGDYAATNSAFDQANLASRMVFDTHSGKLRKLKSA